jgi:hypothetical protein
MTSKRLFYSAAKILQSATFQMKKKCMIGKGFMLIRVAHGAVNMSSDFGHSPKSLRIRLMPFEDAIVRVKN